MGRTAAETEAPILWPPDGKSRLTRKDLDTGRHFPGDLDGKESAHSTRDLGSIPGLGRSTEEGIGYPLQYSCLENSTDCIVHRVTKSQTQLSNFHFHFLLCEVNDRTS